MGTTSTLCKQWNKDFHAADFLTGYDLILYPQLPISIIGIRDAIMMRLGVSIKYSIKRSIADIKYPVMTSHYDRIPLSIFQCQLISYPKRIVIFYQNGIILLPLDPQLISTWPPAALRDLLASILLQEFCWTAGGEAAEVWPPFKESERYHFSTFLEMREFSYIAFDHVLFESMHIGDSQRFAEIPRVENPHQRLPEVPKDW